MSNNENAPNKRIRVDPTTAVDIYPFDSDVVDDDDNNAMEVLEEAEQSREIKKPQNSLISQHFQELNNYRHNLAAALQQQLHQHRKQLFVEEVYRRQQMEIPHPILLPQHFPYILPQKFFPQELLQTQQSVQPNCSPSQQELSQNEPRLIHQQVIPQKPFFSQQQQRQQFLSSA